MNSFLLKVVGVLLATALSFALVGAYNSTSSVQRGYPGVGMEVTEKNDRLADRAKANKLPPVLPAASQQGQLAIDAYKNVQVLGHITSGEMTRLMTAMTIWVAPKQGCAYCHAPQRDAAGNVVTDEFGNPQADQNNLHSDELYTKRVARRMLQMTMHINSEWKSHVKDTGVTCYTCHRGNPVPTYIWYDQESNPTSTRAMGEKAEQNSPATVAGLTALPTSALRTFLVGDEGIRIISTAALPIDNRSSIKQTEWTYSLMMHISTSLGVNCTYCHNSRSMAEWSVSPPARNQAWYGIRMVRDLNKAYLEPLLGTFPAERMGPTGDVPKLHCGTCHQGAFKPLLGQSMLGDYQVLAEAKPQPQKTPVAPAEPAAAVGPDGTPVPAPAGAAVPAAGPAVPPAAAPPAKGNSTPGVPVVQPFPDPVGATAPVKAGAAAPTPDVPIVPKATLAPGTPVAPKATPAPAAPIAPKALPGAAAPAPQPQTTPPPVAPAGSATPPAKTPAAPPAAAPTGASVPPFNG